MLAGGSKFNQIEVDSVDFNESESIGLLRMQSASKSQHTTLRQNENLLGTDKPPFILEDVLMELRNDLFNKLSARVPGDIQQLRNYDKFQAIYSHF